MSGGQLVVLDRLGRDVKCFPLAEGVVTLGSDHSCDIRFMLDSVDPHHATVAVHTNQTVVRNVCGGSTLVNGQAVSVAALRHGDVISIGGRQLRWDYTRPDARRLQAPQPALYVGLRKPRAARRGSGPAAGRRDPALQAALEMSHRASMPGNVGGKQVAIVQPRRRDAKEEGGGGAAALRTLLLRRALGARARARARAPRVAKIQAPRAIDHTKRAAILLMTGHTPKAKLLRQKTPLARSITILDTTDTDSTDRNSTPRYSSRRSSHRGFEKSPLLPTPKKSALKNPLAKKSMRKTESIKFDLSNLEGHSQGSDVLMVSDASRRSEGESASEDELALHYSETSSSNSPSPRRSIHSRSGRILEKTLGATMTISPPSKTLTPESRRARILHRSNAIVQRALNKSGSPRSPQNDLESYSIVDLVSVDSTASGRSTSVYDSATSGTPTQTPGDRSSRKAKSIIDSTLLGSSTPYVKVTRSLSSRSQTSTRDSTRLSDDSNRSTRTGSGSYNSTRESNKSRLSRTSNGTHRQSSVKSRLSNVRSRVSRDGSKSSHARTRLSGDSPKLSKDGTLLSSNSSTLLNDETRYSSILSNKSSSRKSKSYTTPENAGIPISLNSTRISRASRSRSRINDSDLLLVEAEESGGSPKSSKRISTKTSSSTLQSTSASVNATPGTRRRLGEGISTPDNSQSPDEATTPVLSIQSLLDSSHGPILPQSATKRSRSVKRKTFAVVTGPKTRISTKSKSMNFTARSAPSRLSNDSYDNMNISERQDGEVVTPKSAAKPVQEAVKNKHSTAKKPQSKRSIIDDLNESDIVKQLFNSPVKRKLSQSMTEFSRKHLFDDDDIAQARRPTRNTVLGTVDRSPDDSLLDRTEAFSPEQFVSPMSAPGHSPNLSGIKRLFGKSTPENDLRDIRGVKALLRTPRARKPIRDDLTDVAGVKAVFARSPRNRLSDVRVKEVFAAAPDDDLRRVSGVKSLFRSRNKRKSPRNTLSDVRGVKKLFNAGHEDDLRNVSGVKRVFRPSPKNDSSDVRGVKRLFRRDESRNESSDMSGVEELFDESDLSHGDAESLFDRLVGKPVVKAVYSKSFQSRPKPTRKNASQSKSLLDVVLDPEEWLEEKLKALLEKRREEKARQAGAVLHSTPVKRRALHLPHPLAAPELGRVSPIAAHSHTMQEKTIEEKPISRRATRAKPSSTRSPAVKDPPKETRAKSKIHTPTKTRSASVSTKTESPVKPKTRNPRQKFESLAAKKASPKPTRSRRMAPVSSKVQTLPTSSKVQTLPTSNVKKRGAQLVVAKKSPVVSPQPRASRQRKKLDSQTPKVSSKRIRGTRNKEEKVTEKVKTPKSRTAKVQKLSFVVSKPSPQLKPRATRGRANKSEAEKEKEAPKAVKLKEARKTDVKSKKIESPKKSPVNSKSQKTTVEKVQPQTRRGRAAVVKEVVAERARKTGKQSPNKDQEKPAAESKSTRGKKLVQQESAQSEPTSRSRRGAKPATSAPEVNTRKRKTVAPDDRPAKLSKTTESEEGRGRRKKIESPKKKLTKASKETSTQAVVGVAKKSTRSRKVEVSVEVPVQKPLRGKKKAVTEVAPEVGKRKRRTAIESAPVEEVKKARPGRKAVAAPPPQGAVKRVYFVKNFILEYC